MSDSPRGPGGFAVRRRLVAVDRPQLVVGLTPDLCPHLVPSLDRLPAFANTLESWGVDQLAVGDRIVAGAGIVHPNGGEPLPPPDKPLLEPLTLLAAAASCTSTIRLGTSVLLAALRNPVVLAKTVATLDVLSCGRFDLGLGSGWFEGEFAAVGVSLDERWARLEETIHVCRALWRDAPASYHGRWTSFDGAYSRPGPYRASGVPIWIGGWPGRVQARRVALLGDGWIFNTAATPEDVARSMVLLHDACAEIGRDADAVPVRAMVPSRARLTPSIDSLDDQIDALVAYATSLVDAGATHISVPLGSYARDRNEAQHVVQSIARHLASLRVSAIG
ncbi:MAG: TIGR03619 family F420-dependent LLM class oxidoreductase [Acidimicrobiales bacterium]